MIMCARLSPVVVMVSAMLLCSVAMAQEVIDVTDPFDIVAGAVGKVSQDQYTSHHHNIEDMGLGLYGGPGYNQGYRNRDGWAGGGTLGNDEARLYLTDQFAAMGLEVSTQGIYNNIVAELPGVLTPGNIYIVCGHFDAVSDGEKPGGDDNASGTAGVLEAARVLTLYNFDSTLRFIGFNAEEDVKLGSQDYVNAVVVPNDENIMGVINLDMILRPGWDTDPDRPHDLNVETGGSSASVAWANTFKDTAAMYAPELLFANFTYDVRGDHGPFIDAGYPALMAIDMAVPDIWARNNNYYHTSQDASDALANDPNSPSGVTFDYGFATDVVKATVATIAVEAGLLAFDFNGDRAFDFSGDGVVDAQDESIMMDHLGTNELRYDLAPLPAGDGVVDDQDLIVLSEHLFEDYRTIAHWMLDETEGIVAFNSIGDNHGSVFGDPMWQPVEGREDGALQFDGIDDHIATDTVLDPADRWFSVLAWVKGGAPGQVVMSQADGSGNGGTWLGLDENGGLMTGLVPPPEGRFIVAPLGSQAVITDGQWHHVGFVWDGSYRYLYLDGIEVARDTTALVPSHLQSSDGGLYIATSKTLDAGTFFSGLIDDIRIYGMALTADDIAALAQ